MARELSVALDIEGVLADTHARTEERSDLLEPEHCPPVDWDFPTEEHMDEFLHVSQNLWHNHNHTIPPMVDDLRTPTRALSRAHNVDIVTHRSNVDNQLREWLDGYGVDYNDFIVAKGNKSDAGDYDVHIDDSPRVAADAVSSDRYCILIDRPYNQHVKPHTRLERVSDVAEACEFLARADVSALGSLRELHE